ncbi:unnamed protein product [Kuraishia capsulata CBS 1993]|uniref:AAA+ ATPase domain-containing protein n=1 Tax=Kuraishia capsulata CBS 1993 TaxID=1382522 RepID=W6MJX3_9ASCO|nr:uncharacterized protein KUCA_T00000809001 [Kuraishia capsulata CBS 1993]CDK24842.1 unnamed protein product [Kuraishia capsulata CBS 1993]
MSLWADKHRPKTLEQLDFHEGISNRLKSLASSGDFPHLLVYGPPGAGKKTRVLATLREIFGPGVEKLKVDVKIFENGSRKLEFNVISSPYHYEITPSDMSGNDRIVIQDLLKQVAQTESIDFTRKMKFKVVIINEAEYLTRDAQAALRRTMEKYSGNLRLILLCNSTSTIIPPIKSRTLQIRVPSPTAPEMSLVFNKILEKESVTSFDDDPSIFANVAANSERNLRMGIMLLESLYMNNDQITAKTPMILPDWKGVIKNLGAEILKNRNVQMVQSARSTFYDLIAHCIPSKLILSELTWELWYLLGNVKSGNVDQIKGSIVDACSTFDERLSLGQKDIFHLEGFIIKTMVILEKNL